MTIQEQVRIRHGRGDKLGWIVEFLVEEVGFNDWDGANAFVHDAIWGEGTMEAPSLKERLAQAQAEFDVYRANGREMCAIAWLFHYRPHLFNEWVSFRTQGLDSYQVLNEPT